MTGFKAFAQMWDRVETARHDSDTNLFYCLLFAGELVTKVIACSLVSAIQDDRDRHRHRLLKKIVRADGLGKWDSVIGKALTGPGSQHLLPPILVEQKELTQSHVPGTWQFDCVSALSECLRILGIETETMPDRVPCQKWFNIFSTLRNKTRGHGATPSKKLSEICPLLEESIRTLISNLSLFERPWAYLHRNLSGKYRVTPIAGDVSVFDEFKHGTASSIPNGVYFWADGPCHVELIKSNVDCDDFYLPNGSVPNKRFELLSYVTDTKVYGDSSLYSAMDDTLPPSETEGLGHLTVQGECFGNIPELHHSYISRSDLEEELLDRLTDDRHPIISLVGRGGIGKTWLALRVLRLIASSQQYMALLWFSSRDIDLLPEGAKPVRPRVVSEEDISRDFVNLLDPKERQDKGFKSREYLSVHLSGTPLGRPILFVFDNFETTRAPGDLFAWIDIHVRPPNKVLITTRTREFKGDYPVEVHGMTEEESGELLRSVATRLGIIDRLTRDKSLRIWEESRGHPYVMRLMLGELAKSSYPGKIEHVLAGKSDILSALFDRTYNHLSPAATRVFLTLCCWRSAVPKLALEAVLLRHEKSIIDVDDGVRELELSSFIDITRSQDGEGTELLSVPLVASVFGKQKLSVSDLSSIVTSDAKLLQFFGPVQHSQSDSAIAPGVERIFRNVARKLSVDVSDLTTYQPMLEHICRQYAPAWVHLADLYDEINRPKESIQALKSFIESDPPSPAKYRAWNRLAIANQKVQNWPGEIQALIEGCKSIDASMEELSRAANRINVSLKEHFSDFESEERALMLEEMVDLILRKVDAADASDLSKLSWLLLNLKRKDEALRYAERGLALEPSNPHCAGLVRKLREGAP